MDSNSNQNKLNDNNLAFVITNDNERIKVELPGDHYIHGCIIL